MKKLINKWKLNKSVLASKMGMTNTTFNKKVEKNSFSESELIKLKMILRELYYDLDEEISIDFNDALKLAVTKPKN
jgi:hypothetical protein